MRTNFNEPYYFYIRNMQSELNWSTDFEATAYKQQQNAVTTNSPFTPASNLPMVWGREQELMDTSFQEEMGEDHSDAIWKATVNYLRNTLGQKFDQEKGLNDPTIFESVIEFRDSMFIQVDFNDLISKNAILSENQKRYLIAGLKHQRNLKMFLDRLSKLFCEEILEEILFVIYQTWQKYLTYKEKSKVSQELCKLLGPSFTNINLQSLTNSEPQTYYTQYEESQIAQRAKSAGEQIAAGLFISTKLRYLNLKEVEKATNNQENIRREFEILIEVIAKAVYLCCEGCFHHPDGDGLGLDFVDMQRDVVSFSEKDFDQQYDRFHGRKRING